MKWIVWVAGVAMLIPTAVGAAPACEARSGAGTTALLELYTSEGCSSCPPADRWFSSYASQAGADGPNLLAFHVDYWDQIGWPDRFARAAYSKRQGDRVRAGGSSTVYTPQLMLSSRRSLRWNQPAQVASVVKQLYETPAVASLRLQAQRQSSGWLVSVEGNLATASRQPTQMYLALYENGLSSDVRAGENAGTTLHHDRVVRGFWGPWPVTRAATLQRLQISLPRDARAAQTGFVAFIENEASGETLQSLALPLARCASVEAITRDP